MGSRVRIKLGMVVVLVVVALLTTGCPQGAQQKAAVAMRDFALSVKAFQQGEGSLFAQGKIDADTHKRIQGGLLHLAAVGPQIDDAIRKNSKPAAISAIDTALQETDGFLADIGAVQDQSTRAGLQSLVLAIRLILANGKAFLS